MNGREPTKQEIAKFKRAAKALAELGDSRLHIYLEDDTLNLMAGESHDNRGQSNMDGVRASVRIPYSGGGGW